MTLKDIEVMAAGTVNFDAVFGTTNHYGNVDVFAGLYNSGYRKRNRSSRRCCSSCCYFLCILRLHETSN